MNVERNPSSTDYRKFTTTVMPKIFLLTGHTIPQQVGVSTVRKYHACVQLVLVFFLFFLLKKLYNKLMINPNETKTAAGLK